MIASRSLIRFAVLSSFVLLQACGGGDESTPTPDTTPPAVTSTNPTNGATAVLRGASFVVTFSEPIAAASVTASTIVWQTAGGTPVAVPYTAAVTGATVTLTPVTQPLANFAGFTVQITAGVTDAAGNALAAASVQTVAFTTADDVAPTAPGTPADAGAFTVSSPVHFTWTGSTDDGSGVERYWLEVATATDGTGPVYSAGQGLALAADVAVSDGLTVYARVRALDVAGNGQWSPWSDGITVDATPPGAPGTPTSATVGWANGAVSYAWTASVEAGSGVASYRIELRTDTTGTTGYRAAVIGPDLTAAFNAAGLADGETMYTRVQATDNAGNTGAWSGWSTAIGVDLSPPVLPGAVADAGTWSNGSVALFWSAASDPAPGSGLVAGYSLQVSTAPDVAGWVETLPAPGTSETYYATSTFAWPENGYLYARVGAADAVGNSAWGAWSDGVRIDRTAPSAPGTPSDAGAITSSATLHFDWSIASDSGSGVTSYWLQAATATDGSGWTLVDGTVGGALSADVVATNGQTVYARVKATDAVGNEAWSGWSNGILYDGLPPSTPTGVVSTSGGWITDSATFTWTSGVDSTSAWAYDRVELSTTTADDGSGVVDSAIASGPPYAFDTSAAPDGALFYARARSFDVAGNPSAWSTWSSAVHVDRTGPVFAAAPTDDGAWSLTSVAFHWSAPADAGSGLAAGYVVRVNTVPTDLGAFPTQDAAGTSATFDAGNAISFPEGTVLYAQVMATDLLGNASWSDWSDGVAVDRTPPSTLAAPTDPGTRQRELAVPFAWEPSSDATSGVASYTVQVATANDGSGILATQTTATLAFTYTYGGPTPATLYARALATDALGQASPYGPWSNGIVVDPSVPGTPGVPTDAGAFTNSSSVTFDWTPAAGTVTGYLVDIGTAPGLSDVLSAFPVAATSLTYETSFAGKPNGTTYYARVAATDGVGPGGWSGSSDGIVVDTTPPGTPGTPTDNGAVTGPSVRFDWTAAIDAESGVLQYESEVYANGSLVQTAAGVPTAVTFDASTYPPGWTFTARVRAQNGAGTWGAWSGLSDGVVLDSSRPQVINRSPGPGWGMVATNQDLVFRFSEPMDAASVQAAFSLQCGTGCPKNGLAFVWSADLLQVTVIPDTVDPVGVTNMDLLPQSTTVLVALGAGATDLAGNPVQDGGNEPYSFRTGDETAPQLESIRLAKGAATYDPPYPAASVQGGFKLVASFDEDMSASRGLMRIEVPSGSIEARYSQSPSNVQAAVAPGGGQVRYTLFGCPPAPGIQVGDYIGVLYAWPESFNVAGSVVRATGTAGSDCTFTLDNPTAETYGGGGSVFLPIAGDAQLAWTGPRTLEFTVPSYVSLPAGSEFRVSIQDASDAGGMYFWGEATGQIAPLPGADTVAPTLLSAVPLNGAVDVNRNAPVLLRFSEPLDATSVAGSHAADAAGNAWEMRYSSDEMGPVLFFMPRGAPAGGTRVDVHVPSTVRDLAGNPLGADLDLSFDVAVQTDFDVPVLYESQPPDGRPVDGIWQASALFADDGTGMLEMLDSRSVGAEDLAVTDVETGLLVRGFRPRVDSGSGTLQIESPPRSNGFSTGWANDGISTATASGGIATYTTYNPHGLVAGSVVSVNGPMPGCLIANDATVLAGSGNSFTLATTCLDGTTGTNGWANWRKLRTLLVELALPPASGGTGIFDFEGNAMDPTGFTALMTPPGSNRVPTVESLRDLRLGVSTSAMAQQLSAQFRVRDADNDPVSVSITAKAGAVAFSNVPDPDPSLAYLVNRVLSPTVNGADYRLSGDGPPMQPLPPELNDANFPTSGYYPFEVTLDDGNGGVTTYVRAVWVWAPADVPAVQSIDDGGTLRPVDATRPVVVENTVRPGLAWAGVDTANADFIALQYLELSPATVGGNGGGPAALTLDRSVTSTPFPMAVEPTIYAWFATQMKFSPGETNPESQGWSLDFSQVLESAFVYGPANRSLGGRDFGAARASVFRDPMTGAFALASDATGSYGFESRLPAQGAPVVVTETLTSNAGAALGGVEFFAAAPDGRFMLTTTDPAMMNLPLANRGFLGRSGRFFAVAAETQTSAGIEAGAFRDPAMQPFGSIDGTTFAFVQTEVRTDVGGALDAVSASVGEAVAGATAVAVSLTQQDGTSMGPFPVPYTLAPDGLFRMDISGIGAEHVSGYLGGAVGAELAVLAADDNPQLSFFLIMARMFPWQGTETVALLDGVYDFVEYTVGTDGAGNLTELHASRGAGSFDGAGGFAYAVKTSNGEMSGTGIYGVTTVDLGGGVFRGSVALTSDPGPTQSDFLLTVGPDADTVFGVSQGRPDTAQILVFTRRAP